MGKIIAVASHKGGVGKTTTVLNLGFSLSRFGQKVLLVDADPQGAMAVASNLKKRTVHGLINLLKNSARPEEVVIPTKDNTMAVLGMGIVEPEDVFFLEKEGRKGNVGKLIRSVSQAFDYTFIDTPGGISTTVTALLGIADSVLLLINCRTIAVKTLPGFLKLIRKIREKINPGLRLEGVVVTMLNERESDSEIYREIAASFPPAVLFETFIPYDELYEQASMKAIPLGMLPGGEQSARPYMDLAVELKTREIGDRQKGLKDEAVEGLF